MKLLTDEKIISLLPADGNGVWYWPTSLQMAVPGVSQDWLADGVARRIYKVTTVQIDGRDAYQVFWQKNAENILFVVYCAAVSKRDEFALLIKAIRQLAKLNGCRGIGFCTKRRGLIEKIKAYGGEIFGVSVYLE